MDPVTAIVLGWAAFVLGFICGFCTLALLGHRFARHRNSPDPTWRVLAERHARERAAALRPIGRPMSPGGPR